MDKEKEQTLKKHITKTRVVILIAAIAAAVAAVGAFSYFTAAGSGTGSATVGSATAIALSGSPVGTLYPGGADASVTVSITNNGGGAQRVGTISASVADNAGCLGTWFVVDSVAYNQTLPPSGADSAVTAVRMLDSGTNQNVCQGKSMTINWTSN